MRESSVIHGNPFLDAGVQRRRVSHSEAKRNSRLLILSGGFLFMGMAFVSPQTVLPAFVQQLTSSTVMIGLSGALMQTGWAWPQVFISRIVEQRLRKMPLVIATGSGRSALWILIGALAVTIGDHHPGLLLAAFMCLYAISSSTMGIGTVPFMEVIGKSIPSRVRARTFSLRRLLGGITALGAGVMISYVLSGRSGLTFPANYALLFAISGLGTWLGILIFGRIREPVEPVRTRQLALGTYVASGFLLLREDVNYRRLCVMQVLAAFSVMAVPFYVPYSLSAFGIGVAYVGLFVVVLQLSAIVSNVLWAFVGHRKGNRALLLGGSYFVAVSVAIPLLAGYVPDLWVTPFKVLGIDAGFSFRTAFFTLAFVFFGFGTSGLFTGRMAYVLDIAPPERRPTYTSFTNVFMLPQGLMPIFAGLLVGWISYRFMFAVSLIFAPLSILVAHRLEDLRQKEPESREVK